MTDMVLMYGRTFGNGLETRQLFSRNLPDHGTFNAVVQHLERYLYLSLAQQKYGVWVFFCENDAVNKALYSFPRWSNIPIFCISLKTPCG